MHDTGTGGLRLLSNELRIRNAANNTDMAVFNEGSSVELRFNNNTKLLELVSNVIGILMVTLVYTS